MLESDEVSTSNLLFRPLVYIPRVGSSPPSDPPCRCALAADLSRSWVRWGGP
jgi:hypothetical protein